MRMQLLAAALAAMSLSTAAQAESIQAYGEDARVDIPYGDLDLKRPAGAEVMLRRVNQAATVACGGRPDIRHIRERKEFFHCVGDMTKSVVYELNMPLVTTMYLEKVEEDRLASAE
jgi:UrcA family protein